MKKTTLWLSLLLTAVFAVGGGSQIWKISAQETDTDTPIVDRKNPRPTPTDSPSPTPTPSPTPIPTPVGPTEAELREARRQGRADGGEDGGREGDELGRGEGKERGTRDGYQRGVVVCREREENRAYDIGFGQSEPLGAERGRSDGLEKGRGDGLQKGAANGEADGENAGLDESKSLRAKVRAEGIARAEGEGASLAAKAEKDGKIEGDEKALEQATLENYGRGRKEFYAQKLAEAPRFVDSFAQPKPRQPVRKPVKKSPTRRKTAVLSFPPIESPLRFLNANFYRQEDVPIPNDLRKSDPEFRYRREVRNFSTKTERGEYERAYRESYQNSWREQYRGKFRTIFREEFLTARQNGCRSTKPTGYYGDEFSLYKNSSEYRRFVENGQKEGERAGYDRLYRTSYDSAYQTAYQAAYDSAFRKIRDEEIAQTTLGLEEIRRQEYEKRAREINRAAYDKAERAEYAAKMPVYAEQQFALGVKDEMLDLQQKSVRLVEAAPVVSAVDGSMTLTVKIRNFGKTPVSAAALQLVLVFDETQIEIVSPAIVRLAKNLRPNSLTEIKNVFGFKFKNAPANAQTVKIRLLFKGGNVGEIEIPLEAPASGGSVG